MAFGSFSCLVPSTEGASQVRGRGGGGEVLLGRRGGRFRARRRGRFRFWRGGLGAAPGAGGHQEGAGRRRRRRLAEARRRRGCKQKEEEGKLGRPASRRQTKRQHRLRGGKDSILSCALIVISSTGHKIVLRWFQGGNQILSQIQNQTKVIPMRKW